MMTTEPQTKTANSPKQQSARNAAEAVLVTLRGWNIDRVYICPGSTEAGFLDASLDFPDIELVLTVHEAVSMAMADGYSRATGKPSVVYVHTHLGLGNAISHLFCAYLEHSPVIVLAGIKARELLAGSGFTTTHDIRSIVRQFVKWDWQSLTSMAIATDLDRALRISTAVPAGPTFLAFPQDLLESPFATPVEIDFASNLIESPRAEPQVLMDVARRLRAAERPSFVIGGEAAWPEVLPQVETLAELVGGVILFEDKRSISRASMLRNFEGYAGVYGGASYDPGATDLVLFAGARAPLRFEANADDHGPIENRIYLVEDVSELTKDLAGALGVVGDVRKSLEELVDKVRGLPVLAEIEIPQKSQVSSNFRELTCHRYENDLQHLDADKDLFETPMRVSSLMHALVDLLPPGTIIVDDSVTSKTAVLSSVLKPGSGLLYLTTAGGSLGWGMASALGVAQGTPDRKVVAIVGDGVFHFGVQALFTGVRSKIQVTYIVVNNGSYAAVAAALRRYNGNSVSRKQSPGVDLSGPDIATIARGYGASAFTVNTLADLEAALKESTLAAGPVVVDVMTDPGDFGPIS